ncbi:MAG: site-2 protease family protein [Patescibacteria group bacterium]
MGIIEGALIFIVVVLLLVVSHELGHFLTAKWFGIRVDEFGVGLPPRMFGIKRGETLYSINWLPFGGFVRIFGEDEDKDDPRSFSSRGIGVKSLIVAAGVIANVVVGFLILSYISWYGVPRFEVAIEEVMPDTPAQLAGFLPGDRIVGFEGNRLESVNVAEVHMYIDSKRGRQAEFLVMRGSSELRVFAGPRITPPEGQGALGVRINNIQTDIIRKSVLEAPFAGAKMTGNFLKLIAEGMVAFFGSLFTGAEVPGEVVGPIGIAGVAQETFRIGVREFLFLIALLSLHLAVINILPIPALDGGRIAFFVVEKIIRRPIPPRVAGYIHSFFFLILIGFLLWVSWQDIARLI